MTLDIMLNRIVKLVPNLSKRSLQVIYFHEVTKKTGFSYNMININKFKRNMDYLVRNNYNTITFEELNDPDIFSNIKDRKNILITFDDGYINNYELVFPFMKKNNLKFNVFLEAGAISQNDNYITWDMVNEMSKSKLVGFGAHTFNHVDARYIAESNLEEEIINANKLIYQRTGLIVQDFCFPYGMYNTDIIQLLNQSEVYKRLYTSDGRRLYKELDLTLIGRVGIKDEDNLDTFKGKVNGKYNLLYRLNRIKNSRRKGYNSEVFR